MFLLYLSYYLIQREITQWISWVICTSILTALRLVVTGFKARKKTFSIKSVFGWMMPPSCDTEKSSPRLSRPVRRHATGSRVALRIVSVFVSLLPHKHTDWPLTSQLMHLVMTVVIYKGAVTSLFIPYLCSFVTTPCCGNKASSLYETLLD